MEFNLRPMHTDDIPMVMEIEREAFPTAWPTTSFKHELQNNAARYLVAWTPWYKNDDPSLPEPPQTLVKPTPLIQKLISSVRHALATPSVEIKQGNQLIGGYVGIWFTLDEAHITAIAVMEEYRRLGIGELLLQGIIELSTKMQASLVTLEARISNFPAQALYEKYGFHKAGIRKAYYADNREDAVIMTTDPINSHSYQEMLNNRLKTFNERHGKATKTQS